MHRRSWSSLSRQLMSPPKSSFTTRSPAANTTSSFPLAAATAATTPSVASATPSPCRKRRCCHPLTTTLPFPFSLLPRRGYNSCNVPAGQFGHPSITLWNLQPPWDDSAAERTRKPPRHIAICRTAGRSSFHAPILSQPFLKSWLGKVKRWNGGIVEGRSGRGTSAAFCDHGKRGMPRSRRTEVDGKVSAAANHRRTLRQKSSAADQERSAAKLPRFTQRAASPCALTA